MVSAGPVVPSAALINFKSDATKIVIISDEIKAIIIEIIIAVVALNILLNIHFILSYSHLSKYTIFLEDKNSNIIAG